MSHNEGGSQTVCVWLRLRSQISIYMAGNAHKDGIFPSSTTNAAVTQKENAGSRCICLISAWLLVHTVLLTQVMISLFYASPTPVYFLKSSDTWPQGFFFYSLLECKEMLHLQQSTSYLDMLTLSWAHRQINAAWCPESQRSTRCPADAGTGRMAGYTISQQTGDVWWRYQIILKPTHLWLWLTGHPSDISHWNHFSKVQSIIYLDTGTYIEVFLSQAVGSIRFTFKAIILLKQYHRGWIQERSNDR